MTWNSLPDVLTAEDVAAALGISDKAARRLMEENGGIKIARRWMIAKTKLRAIFEQ